MGGWEGGWTGRGAGRVMLWDASNVRERTPVRGLMVRARARCSGAVLAIGKAAAGPHASSASRSPVRRSRRRRSGPALAARARGGDAWRTSARPAERVKSRAWEGPNDRMMCSAGRELSASTARSACSEPSPETWLAECARSRGSAASQLARGGRGWSRCRMRIAEFIMASACGGTISAQRDTDQEAGEKNMVLTSQPTSSPLAPGPCIFVLKSINQWPCFKAHSGARRSLAVSRVSAS